jgi:hypothetical protein
VVADAILDQHVSPAGTPRRVFACPTPRSSALFSRKAKSHSGRFAAILCGHCSRIIIVLLSHCYFIVIALLFFSRTSIFRALLEGKHCFFIVIYNEAGGVHPYTETRNYEAAERFEGVVERTWSRGCRFPSQMVARENFRKQKLQFLQIERKNPTKSSRPRKAFALSPWIPRRTSAFSTAVTFAKTNLI